MSKLTKGSTWVPFTNEELYFGYNIIKDKEYTASEVAQLAKQNAEEYPRSESSLCFMLMRLHVLIHGCIPYSPSTGADDWWRASKTMIAFVKEYDIDTPRYFEREAEWLAKQPKVIEREEALKTMSDFYMANKSWLPKAIVKQREAIINAIMDGVSVEEAFGV
jgi:hypothetical protein